MVNNVALLNVLLWILILFIQAEAKTKEAEEKLRYNIYSEIDSRARGIHQGASIEVNGLLENLSREIKENYLSPSTSIRIGYKFKETGSWADYEECLKDTGECLRVGSSRNSKELFMNLNFKLTIPRKFTGPVSFKVGYLLGLNAEFLSDLKFNKKGDSGRTKRSDRALSLLYSGTSIDAEIEISNNLLINPNLGYQYFKGAKSSKIGGSIGLIYILEGQ